MKHAFAVVRLNVTHIVRGPTSTSQQRSTETCFHRRLFFSATGRVNEFFPLFSPAVLQELQRVINVLVLRDPHSSLPLDMDLITRETLQHG